ncbi:MAG: hypothetical protein UT17_C0007G0028, partial [Candidatus Woesebacteria bacterium GW2011_GWB1_39_10]
MFTLFFEYRTLDIEYLVLSVDPSFTTITSLTNLFATTFFSTTAIVFSSLYAGIITVSFIFANCTMKITFLSQWQTINTRGVETYVTELSQRLKKFGHQVAIHKNIWDHVDASTQILISTNGRLDAIFAKIWCLINHAKLIIPGQSGFGWDDKLNLWVFPDIFIGLSNFQCAWAKRINPWVKTITIPNGVDLDKFNSQVKPYITKKPRPIILNVGVVDSFKRQDLL